MLTASVRRCLTCGNYCIGGMSLKLQVRHLRNNSLSPPFSRPKWSIGLLALRDGGQHISSTLSESMRICNGMLERFEPVEIFDQFQSLQRIAT